MKRTIKRGLMLALTLLALTICLSATAFASGTVASGTCGDNADWSLDSNGTLTITGTGAIDFNTGKGHYNTYYEYPGDGSYNLVRLEDVVTSVVIENGITSIGGDTSYMFASFGNLTDVTIPRSVTSITSGAFFNCYNLTEVIGGSGLTSVGESAFQGCESLTSISIPVGASVGYHVFQDCSGLADNQGLIVVNHVLYDCVDSSITDLTVPSGVTKMNDGAFYDIVHAKYENLRTVTIPEG
ncbi:MAG: leucine-rich repeat domain-containing protein, partial [Oscillospiraceae bacterium]|nr:leucine-rich repeat domain-containing protein [Oscillospiraceae bacterium]